MCERRKQQKNKQPNKQTNNHTNKQASKAATKYTIVKQTSKQTSKQTTLDTHNQTNKHTNKQASTKVINSAQVLDPYSGVGFDGEIRGSWRALMCSVVLILQKRPSWLFVWLCCLFVSVFVCFVCCLFVLTAVF